MTYFSSLAEFFNDYALQWIKNCPFLLSSFSHAFKLEFVNGLIYAWLWQLCDPITPQFSTARSWRWKLQLPSLLGRSPHTIRGHITSYHSQLGIHFYMRNLLSGLSSDNMIMALKNGSSDFLWLIIVLIHFCCPPSPASLWLDMLFISLLWNDY